MINRCAKPKCEFSYNKVINTFLEWTHQDKDHVSDELGTPSRRGENRLKNSTYIEENIVK
jgi:hypothetical protein